MVNETLAQFARCLDVLDTTYRLDEEDHVLRLSFGRDGEPTLHVRLGVYESSVVSSVLIVRAYVSFGFPILLVPSARLNEAYRHLNFLNCQWLSGGRLYIDPQDGDLSFYWVVPLTSEPTPEFTDLVLREVHQTMHFLPEVGAVLADGISAVDAVARHLQHDEEARKHAEASAGEDGTSGPSGSLPPGHGDHDTFPFPF